MSTPSQYSLYNYYILGTDLLRIIPSSDYVIIFVAEIIAILGILCIFYYEILIQLYFYYRYQPSFTKENLDTMNNERMLIDPFVNVKTKYKLICTQDNYLGIQTLADNSIIKALTIGGDLIPSCNKILPNIL